MRRSPWHCQHSPLDLTGGGKRRERNREGDEEKGAERGEKKQEAEQVRAESIIGVTD